MTTAAARLKTCADQIALQYWNAVSPAAPQSPLPAGYPAGGYPGGTPINVRADWVPQVPFSVTDYNLNADFETTGTPDGAATPPGLAVTPGSSGTAYYYSVSQVSNFTESIPAPAVGPAASTGAALTWGQGEAVLSTYKIRRSADNVTWQTWCAAQYTAAGTITGSSFQVTGAGWTVNQWAGYWCTILNNSRFATLCIQVTSNTADTLSLVTTWQPSSGTTTVPPSGTVFCLSPQLTTPAWTDTGSYAWTTLPDFPSSYRHDTTTDITNLRVLLQAKVRLETSAYDQAIARLRPVVYQEWWQYTNYKSWMYFDLLALDRLDPGQGWGNAAAYTAASVYLNAWHPQPGAIINPSSYNPGGPHTGDPSYYRSYTLPQAGWNWQGTYNPAVPYAYPEGVQQVDGSTWWAITSVAAGLWPPPVNEIQQYVITGATGGTYTITFKGVTSAAIGYNSTPSSIQNILKAMSSIGVDGSGNSNVTVSTPGSARVASGVPCTIAFTGAVFAGLPQPLITATSSLTGTSPAITITEVASGNSNTAFWRAMPNYRIDYAWETASMYADAAARFDGYTVTALKQAGFTSWTIKAADFAAAAGTAAAYLIQQHHPATGLPCTQLNWCYPGVPGSGFTDQATNTDCNGGQLGQILTAMCVIQYHQPSAALLAAIRKMVNVMLGVQKWTYRGAWAPATAYAAYDLVSNGTVTGTSNPAYWMPVAAFTSGASFNQANWVPWTGVVYTGAWVNGMTAVQFQTMVSYNGVVYMRTGASGVSTTTPDSSTNWYAISWYPLAAAGALLLWDQQNGGLWGSVPWDGSFDHNGSIPAGTSAKFYYTGYKETGRQLHVLRGLTWLARADPGGADSGGTLWTTWRDQYLGYATGPFWFSPPSGTGGGYLFRQAGDYSVFIDSNSPKLGFGAGAVPPNVNSYTWSGRWNPATAYAAGTGVCALLPSGAFGAYAAGGTGGNPAAGQDPVGFPSLWTAVPAPAYTGEIWATSEAMGIAGTALAEYMEATGT